MSPTIQMRQTTTIVFLLSFFASCEPNGKADGKSIVPHVQSEDDSFETFLDRFSKDSSYQMSRVDFPLIGKVLNLDDNGSGPETLNDTIYFHEYWIKDFSYSTVDSLKYDFTRNIQLLEDSAIVSVTGKENGLQIKYTFKKIKGRWKWYGLKTIQHSVDLEVTGFSNSSF